MQYSMLFYDIPGNWNPSSKLHGKAVRINLSVWVVNSAAIPWDVIDIIKAHGGDVHILPYSDVAEDDVRRLASAALARDIERIMGGLDVVLEDAENITKGDGAEMATRKAWLTKAKKMIAGADAAMTLLGLAPNAQRTIDAARTVCAARMAAVMAKG